MRDEPGSCGIPGDNRSPRRCPVVLSTPATARLRPLIMAPLWRARRAPCSAPWSGALGVPGRCPERPQARWPCARSRAMRSPAAGACAGVAEAVDARVSKTRSFGSVSSSLTARTSRLTAAGARPQSYGRDGTRLPHNPSIRTRCGPRIPHLTPTLSAPRGGEGAFGGATCVLPPPSGEGDRGRWERSNRDPVRLEFA